MGQPVFWLREILPPDEYYLWCAYLDSRWSTHTKGDYQWGMTRQLIATVAGSKSRNIQDYMLRLADARGFDELTPEEQQLQVTLAKERWKKATGRR